MTALTLIFMVSMPIVSLGLIGYDCGDPSSPIVAVSTYSVDNCEVTETTVNTSSMYIQVLSIKRHLTVDYIECKVVRHSLVYRCGAFSHTILVPGSLTIGESVYITADECQDLYKGGTYKTKNGVVITGIEHDKLASHSTLDVGFSDNNGECEGVTVIHNGQTIHKAVIVSNYKIMVSSKRSFAKLATMKLLLGSELTCDYYMGTCQPEGHGRYIWPVVDKSSVCGKVQYDNLFEGWANMSSSATAPVIFTVETKDTKFALATVTEQTICGHRGYTTESDDVVIITGRPGDLPNHDEQINTVDMDLFQETNLKFVYIERHIANKTTDLYQQMVKKFCELNKARMQHLLSLARTDPEEFAWVYMTKPGYTATRRGEVIYLVECRPVEVSIRNTIECYNDLPVTYKNATYFLRPGNRLLVKHSPQFPCSSSTPVLYKLNGAWIKIGGEPYIAPSPVTLNPNPLMIWSYGNLQSLEKIGLLDTEQLRSYRDSIMTPIDTRAASDIFLSRVIYGMKDADNSFNFNRGIDTETIVNNVSDSVISRLYGVWDTVARNLGAILGFAILWDLVCFLASVFLNGFMLFQKYGLSYMLVSACWGGLAKHLLYADAGYFKTKFRKTQSPQVLEQQPSFSKAEETINSHEGSQERQYQPRPPIASAPSLYPPLSPRIPPLRHDSDL